MGYKCEEQLNHKVDGLINIFSEKGINVTKDIIRDYMMKIKVTKGENNLGKIVIYYSPKKDSYTYKRDNDMRQDVFTYIVDLIKGNTENSLEDILNDKTHIEDNNIYRIYVDGSFMDEKVGYGAVIVKKDEPVKELFGQVTVDYAIQSRQVGGEIFAVQESLKWCKEQGIKDITIYYDFQNLEKWATGEYKTNNILSKRYKSFIDSCGMNIKWIKVKSHTGVKWNERADELAKLGINKGKIDKGSKDSLTLLFKTNIENKVNEIIDILNREGYHTNLNFDFDNHSGRIEIKWEKLQNTLKDS